MPMQLFVGPKADSGMNRTVSGCAMAGPSYLPAIDALAGSALRGERIRD
jgi:hypothetical protein